MSKKKMTPAQVAEKIARFIAKQEETLKTYPVGPLGTSAKRNLEKGKKALAALRGKNEEMRMAMQPQGQAAMPSQQMALGGETPQRSLRNYNPGNLITWGNQPTDGGFAVFETPQDGWRALIKQLRTYQGLRKNKSESGITGDSTLLEAMAKYAPAGDGDNDPVAYADFLAKHLGVSPSTPISQIDAKKWATGITAKEGGHMYAFLQDKNLLDSSVVKSIPPVTKENKAVAAEFNSPVYAQLQSGNESSSSTPVSSLATISAAPDMEAEAQRRAALTEQADVLDTQNFLNAQLGNVPNQAIMTGPNNTGYLGGTYGRDATNVAMNQVTPQQAADAAATQAFEERVNSQFSREEQGALKVAGSMDALSPNFSYDEVLNWGDETYGVSEGRVNSRSDEGIDNTIIGANLYREKEGQMIYSKEGIERLGGPGVTVDETRAMLQALYDAGLSKEQAFEAISTPDVYRQIKRASTSGTADIIKRRGMDTVSLLKEKANKWARSTENREQLATVVDRGVEGDANYFPTQLALGVTSDQTMQEGMREYDEQVYDARMERYRELIKQLPAGKTKLQAIAFAALPYTPGAGRTAFSGNDTLDRQVSMLMNQAEDPVGTRQMPDFTRSAKGSAMKVAPIEQDVPEQVLQEQVGLVPETGGTPGAGEGAASLPVKGGEEVASVLPTREIQTASPEMMQVNMPKMNALQAVPAMASLGSAAIQRRALNAMQGPQRPIETAIPQFAYESNIQSTLDDIRNATNTAARGTNLPQQAAAANQQALMANRFRAEGRARAIDNQAKQQAKARYDTMAYQGRAVQNDLRSKYQDDMVGFNNQKAMLDAQIKQQPLNVLASSTQDYLKNIYAPNLAAMFESQGRQYGTNYTEENT
ncbi:hypothetical protein N9F63_00080 [bacterium]|nr:hypothetical protein [bacterium]